MQDVAEVICRELGYPGLEGVYLEKNVANVDVVWLECSSFSQTFKDCDISEIGIQDNVLGVSCSKGKKYFQYVICSS